jgi:hypothetical protein
VELVGVGEVHAAFLNESRARGPIQRSVQEIRVWPGPLGDLGIDEMR